MRTDDEILARIEKQREVDFFGFSLGDLIEVLPYEVAKPFLNEGVSPADWTQALRDEQSVKGRMHDYMRFAWDKANGRRGLSAGRSLMHMSAWLWLLGHDKAADSMADYDRYGKPKLRAICEAFGWDWRALDDGEWVNDEDGPNLGVPEAVDPLPIAV